MRTSSRVTASLVLLACLSIGTSASADDATVEPTATQPRSTTTTWYGWQTLLVDAGALGASLVSRSWLVFAGTYSLGAPIVHFAHHNVLRGVASLGVRVAAPILAGLTYYAVDPKELPTGHEAEEAGAFGVLAGGIAAVVFDAALLAYDVRRAPPPPPAALTVEPRLSASPTGAYAGIGGTF